VRYNNT